MKIAVEDISPRLLHASYFDGSRIDPDKFESREVYDYEIEYYVESAGGIIIDGRMTRFESGSVNFRSPGQIVRGVPPYKCYLVVVDILGGSVCSSHGGEDYTLGSAATRQPAYENEILSAIPSKIPAAATGGIGAAASRIYAAHCDRRADSELEIRSNLYGILLQLYRAAAPQDNPHVQRALRYMRENFTRQIKAEDIAGAVGINVNYFHAIFRAAMGASPMKYIVGLRMERSKLLLLTTALQIGEIADICGFGSSAYFAYAFRQSEGVAPAQYRELHRVNK